MSNTNDFTISDFSSAPAARVSYTLDNSQPVICTHIGQEPLFYFDHDIDVDAEEEYGDTQFTAEFENFNKETGALDRLTNDYKISVDDYISQFNDAKNSLTGQQDYRQNSFTSIDDVLTALSQSRLAQAYIDCAEKYDTQLVLDDSVPHGQYDRDNGYIAINSNLEQSQQILVALRELRRHWQHRNGALVNPMSFHPDNAVLINRMQHADLITSVVRGAWELKLAGYSAPWKAVSNSSYQDIARAFAREAHLNFRTLNDGFASTAAFEAWFLSERCRATDKTLIRSMLTDNQGYVFDITNEHASITSSIIAALGEQPLGKNYLVKHVNTLMSDPIFNEVRDRSNANFLWFIKFERSFRETEHDLQNDSSSDANTSFGTSHTSQGQADEAQIVVLYDGTNQPEQNPGNRLLGSSDNNAKQSSAEIIHLRQKPHGFV